MVEPCRLRRFCHLVKPGSVTLGQVSASTQSPLPKMPVPPLKQTCELYLGVLETFLEPKELKRTEQLVEDFLKPGGVGEKLQRGLERKAETTENWLTDDFLKYEVLIKRKPVVIRLNFGILCPRKDVKDKREQLRCAAEFIATVLDIKTMVDNETLPVEFMGGKPLCMKQYEQVFSSCCLPGPEVDSLLFLAKSFNPPKHITVVHNGQFFALDVYNSDGNLLTVDQLRVQLQRICESSQQTDAEPVGLLTTQPRDAWSKSHTRLMQDETNKASLTAIESSIFTLCLDGPMPPQSDEMKYRRSGLLQMLHGGGSQWFSGNRWFDKGLQIIIGEDGTRGINCEHTVADGTVLMAICDHAVNNTNRETAHVTQAPRDPLAMPQKLHFNITPEIRQDIEEARQHLDTLNKSCATSLCCSSTITLLKQCTVLIVFFIIVFFIPCYWTCLFIDALNTHSFLCSLVQNVDMTVTVFGHFGKTAIKAQKLSPDAFVQMAIQLAFYRVYKKIGAMLEPATLRLFTRGRLIIMPTNSTASAAFVKAFDDPNQQNLVKVELLEKAVKEHRKRTDLVLSGHGIAAHFIGLMSQAIEKNIPMPDIFTDASYTQVFDVFEVSTSQVTSRTGCLLCNSLDQPGMYDVDYSIMDKHIDCRVSALEASNTKEKSPTRLSRALDGALLDMMSLLEATQSPTGCFRPE
ncbi:carnitine O-acetyltransferase-like [Betta splendens]|uniref:Carnitine O-acetyltransferase-like n=1 Tax=Betta splendens TaxID=158456 RepID=A0A9W2XPF9_BETSP|nr:carnitine O-acetyltransferase-like [Betta splendens]